MKRILLSLALLSAFVSYSQTIVPPGYVSGTWTAEGSPYLIQGDIQIGDDFISEDSLFIEAGVEVIFENYGTLYVSILSKLYAQGELNDSVVFTVADTTGYSNNTHLGWGGIDFGGAADGYFEFAKIEFSKDDGLLQDGYAPAFELENTVIQYNQSCGINVIGSSGSLVVKNSILRYNNSWAIKSDDVNTELYNLEIDQCGKGITNTASNVMDQINLMNCLGDGIVVTGYATASYISNFNIAHCSGIGIVTDHHMSLFLMDGTLNNNEQGMMGGYEAIQSLDNVIISNHSNGGFLSGGYPRLNKCMIYSNQGYQGAGIRWDPSASGGGSIQIDSCLIYNNIATESGGGIYFSGGFGGFTISNSRITNNSANRGGGIATEDFLGYSNISMISNVLIDSNNAIQFGGGIDFNQAFNYFSLGFYNTEICFNCSENGGGICAEDIVGGNSMLKNILIHNNIALNNGGGIYISNFGYPQPPISNSTIFNNTAQYGGGLYFGDSDPDDSLHVLNCILYSNFPEQAYDPNNTVNINYSNIQNTYPGTGNIDADPLFTDPANNDYSLSWDNFPFADGTKSPCIDTGDPGSDGDPDGTPADMGYKPFDQFDPKVPEIVSIPDVPGDQGQQVVINWSRSAMDHPDTAVITEYSIWRIQDWAENPMEYMGSTPAQFFDEYAFIAPTVTDSSASGVHYYKFVILALTDQPEVYYTSAIDSGYSVDNLSPEPPGGMAGYFTDEQVFIEWSSNTEEDFSHYTLYRSDSPGVFPEDPYIQTADSLFIDDSIPETDTLYYQLAAVDLNGNESEKSGLAIPVNRNVIVEVKVFLEGPFEPLTGLMNSRPPEEIAPEQPFNAEPWFYDGNETQNLTSLPLIDWMLLEIRQGVDAEMVAQQPPLRRKAVLVLADGSLIDDQGNALIEFDQEVTQDLFVTLWHGNHLGVQSAFPLEKIQYYYTYDFTLNSGQAFGGSLAQKELSSNIWGVPGGDGDRNGTVEMADLNLWVSYAGLHGTPEMDYNVDGEINNQDKNDVWWENVGRNGQIPLINPSLCGQTFVDLRDGQTYSTVLIGEQCWMAENLNFETGNSWCFDDNTSNCDFYGRLYDWSTVMNGAASSNAVPSGVQGVCPEGWHVPSDAEWCNLTLYIDSTVDCGAVDWSGTDAGIKMKSISDWTNGTNTSGFTALPGGFLNFGTYYFIGTWAAFWSSTESDDANSWARILNNEEDGIRRDDYTGTNGFSLRCVKE